MKLEITRPSYSVTRQSRKSCTWMSNCDKKQVNHESEKEGTSKYYSVTILCSDLPTTHSLNVTSTTRALGRLYPVLVSTFAKIAREKSRHNVGQPPFLDRFRPSDFPSRKPDSTMKGTHSPTLPQSTFPLQCLNHPQSGGSGGGHISSIGRVD